MAKIWKECLPLPRPLTESTRLFSRRKYTKKITFFSFELSSAPVQNILVIWRPEIVSIFWLNWILIVSEIQLIKHITQATNCSLSFGSAGKLWRDPLGSRMRHLLNSFPSINKCSNYPHPHPPPPPRPYQGPTRKFTLYYMGTYKLNSSSLFVARTGSSVVNLRWYK